MHWHRVLHISAHLAAIVSLVMWSSALVKAQGLPPCPGIGPGSEPYFIFLDPIEWTGASKDVNSIIQSKMKFAVQGQVESLNTELGGFQFVDGQPVPLLAPVLCNGRIPSGEFVFDDNEFQALSQNKVVLEIWGSILDPGTGEGSLSFVLVPAHSYTKPAIYSIDLKLGSAAQAQRSMPEFLRTTKRLMAYIEMVLGVRLFENGSYAQSITHMCRGIGQLERALNKERPHAAPGKITRDDRLVADLKQVVARAIDQQRQHDEVAALASSAPKTCPTGGN